MSETRATPCASRPQVYELTLRYTQHQDHNVVTGALELLQQLFRTPPPELLQALTTAGGLAQLPAARDQPGGRGRSGSIAELIGESLGRPTPNEPGGDAGQPACVRRCALPLLRTKLTRRESSRPYRERNRSVEGEAAKRVRLPLAWPPPRGLSVVMRTLGEVFPGPVISVTVPEVGSSSLLGRSEFLSALRSLLAVLTT